MTHMSSLARRVQLLLDTSTQLINCHVNCKERGAGERNDRTSARARARRAVRASDMAQRTREAVSLSARITALIGAPCWAGHLGCLQREAWQWKKSKRECMQNTFAISSFEKGQTRSLHGDERVDGQSVPPHGARCYAPIVGRPGARLPAAAQPVVGSAQAHLARDFAGADAPSTLVLVLSLGGHRALNPILLAGRGAVSYRA